jgi:DNA-directed RNA polymerase specialized sigma24 family protein
MPLDSDLELIKRCLKAEDAAWEALLQAHTHKIYNLCYHFTGRSGDAEDLTQEIFIKVFRTLRSYDPLQAKFSTWINRIARNHLVDHYRRTRNDRVTSTRRHFPWAPSKPGGGSGAEGKTPGGA